MTEPKRWDDITFKQLKRFWPIIIFVACGAYAVGKAYANIMGTIDVHEKRLTSIEASLSALPKIQDGIDTLLRRTKRGY